jgi:hypothetical protein
VANTVRLRTGAAPLAVDVQGDGGYVVAPGSVHASGEVYERVCKWPAVTELELFDMTWIAAPAAAPRHQVEQSRPAALTLARKYLEKTPPAIQGQGGTHIRLLCAADWCRRRHYSQGSSIQRHGNGTPMMGPQCPRLALRQRELREVRVGERLLSPADLKLHQEALRIDSDVLGAAGVRRTDDREARDLLSIIGKAGGFSGVVYPYNDPQTGQAPTFRIRLDHPVNGNKYGTPYGDNRHLYFSPGAAPLLADNSVPVVIVEGEKSALASTSAAKRAKRTVLVIALGGCWNWRGRIGKTIAANGERVDDKGPLSDFHLFAWRDREAIVCFDARPNDSVQAARQQLARTLRAWGAIVKRAHLPNDDTRINGPDDLIRYRGDEALWHSLD